MISSVAINESTWEENSHFVINCHLKNRHSQFVPSLALIDSGASAYGFVNTKFVRTHDLKTISLSRPRSLKVFDGTESSSGLVTHMAQTCLDIEGHSEPILLFVTSLAYFDIVLGLPWLQHHNLIIQLLCLLFLTSKFINKRSCLILIIRSPKKRLKIVTYLLSRTLFCVMT